MTDTNTTIHETPCTCVSVEKPCYLWIHLPQGPGRIITFPSPALAYAFADNYISGEMATLVADSDGQYVPDVQRDITLCRLSREIATGVNPVHNGHWFIMSSDRHQMLVGLGENVPMDLLHVLPSGYTLEAHDKTDDMPPLVYLPVSASSVSSEPLSILTRFSKWIIGDTGAKSPHVDDEVGFGGAV
jgi:hypothetical protein